MMEVQTANLLSEADLRAIFGDYGKWRFNLLQVTLRDANTTSEVARILEGRAFSGESKALIGLLCGIALKCLSSQLLF